MKTLALGLLLASSSVALAKRPAPGERAPEFSAPATDGRTVKLGDFADKTFVLAFYPKAFTGG